MGDAPKKRDEDNAPQPGHGKKPDQSKGGKKQRGDDDRNHIQKRDFDLIPPGDGDDHSRLWDVVPPEDDDGHKNDGFLA